MALSVGLGRIINDPEASVLVRKALGVLSTPWLLVTDTGVTIDGTGKIALQLKPSGGSTQDETGLSVVLKPSGGLTQDETGLSLETVVIDSVNVDNVVTPNNHLLGNVSIGTTVVTTKLSVLSTTEQFRLLFNESNHCKFTVASNGDTAIQPVGTNADLGFVTTGSGGIKINDGTPIKKVLSATASIRVSSFPGGIVETVMTVLGAAVGDAVFVSPNGSPFRTAGSNGIAAWSAYVSSSNTVRVRFITNSFDNQDTRSWRATVFQF